MQKFCSYKTLSALALLCFLASHSEQTHSQNNLDTLLVITRLDITARLDFINAGCIDLNAEIFKADKNNADILEIERLQKLETYLIFEFDFIENLSKQFLISDKSVLEKIQAVKNNIELITVNTETLTDNFYKKNATNQIAGIIFNKLIEVIKFQYPFLNGMLDLFLKYNNIAK